MSSDNNTLLNRDWIIPLLPEQLPGVITLSGRGFYEIECFIESLPLLDGTIVDFY